MKNTSNQMNKTGCMSVQEYVHIYKMKNSNKSRNKSLISVDRRTKPTLILTILRSLFKSSTKDLSLAIFEIMIQSYDLGPKPIVIRFQITKGEYRRFPAWILT